MFGSSTIASYDSAICLTLLVRLVECDSGPSRWETLERIETLSRKRSMLCLHVYRRRERLAARPGHGTNIQCYLRPRKPEKKKAWTVISFYMGLYEKGCYNNRFIESLPDLVDFGIIFRHLSGRTGWQKRELLYVYTCGTISGPIFVRSLIS